MISACVGFKDRDERLLKATVECVLSEGVDEVMLCNFGQKRICWDANGLYHIHIPLDRWRLGLAFDICAVHAVGDVLLLINGGIVLSRGIVEKSLPSIIPGKQFVSSAIHYMRCTKEATKAYLVDPGHANPDAGAQRYDGPTGEGDFYLIDRADYLLTIGGHDSEMQGWGRENVCFHRRAKELGFERKLGHGMIFHLYDGFPGTRKEEEDYKINDQLLKTKKAWWRNDKR